MTTLTKFRRVLFSGLACAPLLLTGCGGDSSGPDIGARFVLLGTFSASDASQSGSVSFSINNTAVTGTVRVVSPAAATGTLTGTYNSSTEQLTASGGGYTFAGEYDGSAMAGGTFTGPGGSTGLFAAHVSTSNARAFCGTYVSQTNTAHGVFNFTVDGTTVTGLVVATFGGTTYLGGTVSASGAVHIIDAHFPHFPPQDLATGQITGTNVSGTWDDGAGNHGTWTGSLCS
jgi:hypothetical protein